jgi:hypothetical protein
MELGQKLIPVAMLVLLGYPIKIVLPSGGSAGAKLGDLAVVFNGKNGKIVNAIYADVGPSNKIGEGSIALAEALAIPSSPRTGGVSSGVILCTAITCIFYSKTII